MKHKKNSKHTKKEYSPAVKGTLEIARHGMGYVIVPNMSIDIIVRKENLKSAMHGDTVEVNIFKINPTSKRPEGVISKIVKRGQTELIGTVQLAGKYAFVIPDNKSFTKDIFVNEKRAKGLTDGDRVIVKIIDWNEKMKNPEGEITDKLSSERTNEIAMKQIVLQQGFSLDFPGNVLDELHKIPSTISPADIDQRLDLRDTLTLTIDPHDAKDFDDAISIRYLEDDEYEIGVHIADVSHYVKPGTALDQEAYKRATSVYLPDRVIPMLPEKISNELCSLRPLEDKLTFSVLFVMNKKAEVKKTWIGKTIIHSNHRFTYEEAQLIIEGEEGPFQHEIRILNKLSQKLRKKKFKAGAINFSSEEARFILDEHGIPTEVLIKENNESHQLIEELMLLANKTIAEFIAKKKLQNKAIPFPYRIHDTPDIEKLKPYAEFAYKFGYKFDLSSPDSISKSFNKMIEKSSKKPEDSVLHTLGIRTMAKAVYSPENIGHYGLAFDYYCHFTSPIRRYPDVLVHRILYDILELNQKAKPIEQMEEFCNHCSERERKAMEAEREGHKYKQVEFMRKFIGEEFDAIISGVSNFGFWAQTTSHRCEGFISLFNLDKVDEFSYSDEEYALIGKRTKQKFQIGKKVKIKVISASLEKRQIDFDLIN